MGLSVPQSTLSKSLKEIEIYRGQYKEIEFDLSGPTKDPLGNVVEGPFDLTGCELLFTVRAKADKSSEILIRKDSTDVSQIAISVPSTGGVAVLYLQEADTLPMLPGKYVFDLWVKLPSGKPFPVVEVSEFIVLSGVGSFS